MSVSPDPRHLPNGWLIPSEGYADQPFVVKTDDSAWLCVITTGTGNEGDHGQHVISMRSTDRGKSWTNVVDIEPADGPEASYAVLLKVPGGRIYCFYNHNTDNLREILGEDGSIISRVDSQGYYVFKYSDDQGRSWSAQRYPITVREFACDRENVYHGRIRFFWNVGRPLILGDAAILCLHKVGAMGEGFFAQSEGAFLRSVNILTETDPAKITFETLPDGDIGLRTPVGGGRIAEEQNIVALSDGSLFCVYRTVDGYPAYAYSRDGGHTWDEPAYLTYTPGGKRIKHPRAANFVWRCANGRYLYWYHNHGGTPIRTLPNGWDPYNDRNPAWLAAGIERDSPNGKVIHWSQPEILLYDDDPYIRMSYPDLIEEDGHYYVTETQKCTARLHEIPPLLIDGLFKQHAPGEVALEGLALECASGVIPTEVPMPGLPAFLQRDYTRSDHGVRDLRAGFSIELQIRFESLQPGQVLLDNHTPAGQGICLRTTAQGSVEIVLNDGRTENRWECDPQLLQANRWHHIAVIVDGGPKIITFLIDGVLCDGGECRQFGWGRFSPHLQQVHGDQLLRIGPSLHGDIAALRIYTRALRTSEMVGNWQAGKKKGRPPACPVHIS
ncbi:MAG: LamG-like jellyroll fold domain-containing protein [Armatimonadota bacterium]